MVERTVFEHQDDDVLDLLEILDLGFVAHRGHSLVPTRRVLAGSNCRGTTRAMLTGEAGRWAANRLGLDQLAPIDACAALLWAHRVVGRWTEDGLTQPRASAFRAKQK